MIKTCAIACFSLSFYFINAFRKLGKFYRERIKRKQTQRLSVMFCFRCQGGARLPPRQAHFLHSPLPYISPKKRTSPETLTKFAKRKNYPLAALPLSDPSQRLWYRLGNAGTRYHRARKSKRNATGVAVLYCYKEGGFKLDVSVPGL